MKIPFSKYWIIHSIFTFPVIQKNKRIIKMEKNESVTNTFVRFSQENSFYTSHWAWRRVFARFKEHFAYQFQQNYINIIFAHNIEQSWGYKQELSIRILKGRYLSNIIYKLPIKKINLIILFLIKYPKIYMTISMQFYYLSIIKFNTYEILNYIFNSFLSMDNKKYKYLYPFLYSLI